MDPAADEKHNLSFSPYNYCINNPIKFIDPSGEDWVESEDGTITWKDKVYRNSRGRVVGLNDNETYRGTEYRRFENIGDENITMLVIIQIRLHLRQQKTDQIMMEYLPLMKHLTGIIMLMEQQ